MDFYIREIVALLLVWLGLVALVGFWAVRILLMLARQRRAERAYRMQLAMAMGQAVREGRAPGAGPRR